MIVYAENGAMICEKLIKLFLRRPAWRDISSSGGFPAEPNELRMASDFAFSDFRTCLLQPGPGLRIRRMNRSEKLQAKNKKKQTYPCIKEYAPSGIHA